MKTSRNSNAWVSTLIFLAAFFFILSQCPASLPPTELRYYKRLKSFDLYGASYDRVEVLVAKLVTLSPKKARKYLHLGITRLNTTNSREAYIKKLIVSGLRIVKRSGLPPTQITKIFIQVDRLDPDYGKPSLK